MVERLTAISGSMYAGKTEKLIWYVTRAEIAGKRVQIFKPIIDERYGAVNKVVSHSKSEHSALALGNSIEILSHIHRETQIVAIDEVQFFDKEIIRVIKDLVDRDIEVIVAGLPLDFRGEPFGQMPIILAMADCIDRLHAICDYSQNGDICGELATRTQRLIDGEPAGYNDPIVLVGGRNEGYRARCPNHHIVIDKPALLRPRIKT